MRSLALIALLALPGLAQAQTIPANCQGVLEFSNWRVVAGSGQVTVRNTSTTQSVLLNARFVAQGTQTVGVNFMPTVTQVVNLGPVPPGTSPNRLSSNTTRQCSAGMAVGVFPGGPVR